MTNTLTSMKASQDMGVPVAHVCGVFVHMGGDNAVNKFPNADVPFVLKGKNKNLKYDEAEKTVMVTATRRNGRFPIDFDDVGEIN